LCTRLSWVDGAAGHLVWSLEQVIACGAHATAVSFRQ
jgi:hypothetical protein